MEKKKAEVKCRFLSTLRERERQRQRDQKEHLLHSIFDIHQKGILFCV